MTTECESRLQSLSKVVPEGQLRMFGCECCKRLLTYWRNPMLLELIALGETRSTGEVGAESDSLSSTDDHNLHQSIGDGACKELSN